MCCLCVGKCCGCVACVWAGAVGVLLVCGQVLWVCCLCVGRCCGCVACVWAGAVGVLVVIGQGTVGVS